MVGRQVQLFQVEVVNEDSTLARIIESHEKIGECAFPCSGVTNHRCHSTRAEFDAELPDHLKIEEDYYHRSSFRFPSYLSVFQGWAMFIFINDTMFWNIVHP